MIIRTLRRRVSQAERSVLNRLHDYPNRQAKRIEWAHSLARLHASAVAGIVLHGEPKLEEPLLQSWMRTVAEYSQAQYEWKRPGLPSATGSSFEAYRGLFRREHNGSAVEEALFESYFNKYLETSDRIYADLMYGINDDSIKFTEVFKAAPIWLLEFTCTTMDAGWLRFSLPDLSGSPEWGEVGLRSASVWPLLPARVKTEGERIPRRAIDPSFSAEDAAFAVQMLLKPEAEWSRAERRRMCKIGSEVNWSPKARRER